MNISGTCDFCECEFHAEGMLLSDRGVNKQEVYGRPYGWAVHFPWNRRKLPNGCNFTPESLKQHGITTKTACPSCVRRSIELREIERIVFGNDDRAINRHSVRVYETRDALRFQLDRTLDVSPLSFQLYGPYHKNFEGFLPDIKVDGKEYWGDGWTWKKAEAAMCRILNAKIRNR